MRVGPSEPVYRDRFQTAFGGSGQKAFSFCAHDHSALYPTMRELDRDLALWAKRKYKKLRQHLRKAKHWIARLSRRAPELFAHWQMGARRGSMMGAV